MSAAQRAKKIEIPRARLGFGNSTPEIHALIFDNMDREIKRSCKCVFTRGWMTVGASAIRHGPLKNQYTAISARRIIY